MIKTNETCPICRQSISSLIFYEKTPDGKFKEVESLEFKLKSQLNQSEPVREINNQIPVESNTTVVNQPMQINHSDNIIEVVDL